MNRTQRALSSSTSDQPSAELNQLRIPSPRRSTWAVSAIYGNRRKTCGILNNPLYVGQYIWNRSQWVKDPDTGKRRRIERPETEWRVKELPDLRIVPDDLWQTVKRRQGPNNGRGSGKAALLFPSVSMLCGS